MLGTMLASMPNPANTSTRKRDGTTLRSHARSALRAMRERREMVGRLAAAIVQDDGPAEQPRDQNGRERRQQERGIRGREHVDDVGAANLRDERRNIDELVDDRPQVFDRPGESKRSGKRGFTGTSHASTSASSFHWRSSRLA